MTTAPIPSISDEQISALVCECRQGADDHAGMGHEFDANLFDRLADALIEISGRLRAAERDAERYRWLRDSGCFSPSAFGNGWSLNCGYTRAQPESLDDAVDTAMKGDNP